jgi:acyl-CoA dehydrogenase
MTAPPLTEAHEAFRTRVRTFLERHVIPHAGQWEADGRIPRSLWRDLAAERLLGLAHRPEVGGTGDDIFHAFVFLEELGRTGYAGIRAAIGVHCFMATRYLADLPGTRLEAEYLRPAVAGEKVAGLALTEPGAGSDLSGLRATLTPVPSGYRLDGEKSFIANGLTADFFVVAAKIPAGDGTRKAEHLSLCVVDSPTAGLEVTANRCLGWHSASVSDLVFRNVFVPAENLIGRPHSGLMRIMKAMQLERLAAAAMAIGGAAHALDETVRYVASREAFGAVLASRQVVRHRIAEMATEIAAARQLALHAAACFARNPLSIAECSMAKLKCTEVAKEVAGHCQQLWGAAGYREGSTMARILRDAQAATITAGSSEVMLDIVAQSLLEAASRTPGLQG